MANKLSGRALRAVLAELWSMRDVAEFIGVHPMTIWSWKEDRGLPYLYLPGTGRAALRFHPQEIRDWCAAQGIVPEGAMKPKAKGRASKPAPRRERLRMVA